jgi:cyclopropane fatty-acyl-phospholipid synthase-like methyltransferase
MNKDVYEKAFSVPDYNSGGSQSRQYEFICSLVRKHKPTTLIDVGSGRGNALKMVHNENPDTTIDTLDLQNFHNLPFVRQHYNGDITVDGMKETGNYDMVICTDFLEHIQLNYIDIVLSDISKHGNRFVFTVANHSDVLNGTELHLIQEDMSWWTNLIKMYYHIDDMGVMIPGRLFYFDCGKFV